MRNGHPGMGRFAGNEVRGMTQKDRILQYMMQFGSITPVQAFADLGVMRLSARIYDLEADGVQIGRHTEKAKNRYGETVHYTRYYIDNERS